MNRELIIVIEQLAREKGIDPEILFEAVESALLSGCRKTHAAADNARIEIDWPDLSKPETLKVTPIELTPVADFKDLDFLDLAVHGLLQRRLGPSHLLARQVPGQLEPALRELLETSDEMRRLWHGDVQPDSAPLDPEPEAALAVSLS